MIDIGTFKTIAIQAKKDMKLGSDGATTKKTLNIAFIFLFYILPFLSSLSIILLPCLKLSGFDGIIGTVISIFTGLFFSLLLSVSDKIRNEKKNENKDNSSFLKYKESMRQISNLILYVIVVGIEIFSFLILNLLFQQYLPIHIKNLFIGVIIFLLVRYVILLLSIIQRFYYTTKDEINGIL